MPIRALQQRLTQVGVIRLGQQLVSQRGKSYPAKLTAFRFTSPSEPLIRAVAAEFGGTPRPWRNGNRPEWEVLTPVSTIRVLVPPQHVDPNYELWGPGVRLRLCDGETERTRDAKCLCRQEFGEDFTRTAPAGKACKPTLRVSLMLADIPSLGTWKVESHGWNAAAELPTLVNAIASAGVPLPGTLTLAQREKAVFNPRAEAGKEIEQRNYVVPVLDIDAITPGVAYSNQLESAARAALAGRDERPALAATPAAGVVQADQPAASAAPSSADWIARIAATSDPGSLDALMAEMRTAGVRDTAVVDAWKVQAAKVSDAGKPATAARAARKAPAPAADGDVVDAEFVDDDKPGAKAWQDALMIAGDRGWNVPTLAAAFETAHGFDYRDDRATDEVLIAFRDALRSGAIK